MTERRGFGSSTTRRSVNDTATPQSASESRRPSAVGHAPICTIVPALVDGDVDAMAALVDTNVLVYRFDLRFPQKQAIATDVLRRGIVDDSIRIAHQAIVEFVAAVTRPLADGSSIL